MEDATLFAVATITATLLGPILAVQAQKWIERSRDSKNRKSWILHTLMATRGSTLSTDHVQALNMIDLAFYGGKLFLWHRRTKSEKNVLNCWRDYHHQLNQELTPENWDQWHERRHDLFVLLLESIAGDLGYSFDRVQIRNGSYTPVAYSNVENEQAKLRRLAIDVLSGEQPIKMGLDSINLNPDFIASQTNLQAKMASALSGETSISVVIAAGEPPAATPAPTL